MKTTIKILSFALLLLGFSACTQESKPTLGGVVPLSGEVEYEVSYSKDIINDLVVGQFLPKTFEGVYNQNGIKMGACCGFGMVKINMILGPSDSYADLTVPEGHLIMPLKELIVRDSIEAHSGDFTIERDDNLVEICGYKSKTMRVIVNYSSDESKYMRSGYIEIFYAPIEGVDFSIAGIPQFTIPGLVTAMKMSSDDSSVILMLSKVKEKKVNDDVFRRPGDAKLATVDMLAQLYSNMQ